MNQGRGGEEQGEELMRAQGQSPPAHQLAYWTTVCPNPALGMGKMVGLSVSKLKQREEATPGEEGAGRSFAEVLPVSLLGPAPPVSPLAALLQTAQGQRLTQWQAGKFQLCLGQTTPPS